LNAPAHSPLPLASISLDLDNLWAYLKVMGDDRWRSRPNYLPEFVPFVLDFLRRFNLRITFFIVGADCENEANRDAFARIGSAGHEAANHSHEHRPWMPLLTTPEIDAEIAAAENAISFATGQKPVGFRAPGYSWSSRLLRSLARRGYVYDASTLPTFISPLARLYFYQRSTLSTEERRRRKNLFGSFKDGFLPLRGYRWDLGSNLSLLEIPVTTTPIFRTPFHMTYLSLFSAYSRSGTRAYLRAALKLCRVRGVSPSFLLHPLDFWGGERIPELKRMAGMSLPSEVKVDQVARVLRMFQEHFELVPMNVHARILGEQENLRICCPPLEEHESAAEVLRS